MEVRHLTTDDVVPAAHVFVTSLGSPPPKQPERFQHYWDVATSLGAFDEAGRVLGVAARFPSQMTAPGGAALACTVVPSVGVRPDRHRAGVGRALLERQVHEAREHGDAVMALNASEVAIYGRYGYGPTSAWWSVEADPRALRWHDDAPRAAPGSVDELALDAAMEEVPQLYARAFGGWGGEVARHDGWWWAWSHPREDAPVPIVAVHRDQDGVADAAVTFTSEQAFDATGFANRIEIQDLFGLTPRDEALLVRWLSERHLAGKLSADRFSPRSPVPWMLSAPRRWRTTFLADAAWVRVLDLPTTVTARPAGPVPDGVGLTVAVVDPLIGHNARTWRVSAEGGRLRCEPSDHAPDLTLGIDRVPPLLWGYSRCSTLVDAGRIGVTDPAAVPLADRLFAVTEPAWSSTGF